MKWCKARARASQLLNPQNADLSPQAPQPRPALRVRPSLVSNTGYSVPGVIPASISVRGSAIFRYFPINTPSEPIRTATL